MNSFALGKYLIMFLTLFSLQHFLVGQTTELLGVTNNGLSAEAQSKETDIKKLISAMGGEDLVKQALPKMVAQLKQAMPQVPDEFWNEFQRPERIKQLMEIYVRIYDKHFTHEEIKEMLAFYSTPLGKKMIATMPLVWQEAMDGGNKWGTELANRIATNHPSSASSATIQRPLTEQEKRRVLKAHGYDPDRYELEDDGTVYEKSDTRQGIAQSQNKPMTLQPDMHYMVQFTDSSGGDTTYFSKDEPKPFGNGFKFKPYGTDMEITVSGNVQITKLPSATEK